MSAGFGTHPNPMAGEPFGYRSAITGETVLSRRIDSPPAGDVWIIPVGVESDGFFNGSWSSSAPLNSALYSSPAVTETWRTLWQDMVSSIQSRMIRPRVQSLVDVTAAASQASEPYFDVHGVDSLRVWSRDCMKLLGQLYALTGLLYTALQTRSRCDHKFRFNS